MSNVLFEDIKKDAVYYSVFKGIMAVFFVKEVTDDVFISNQIVIFDNLTREVKLNHTVSKKTWYEVSSFSSSYVDDPKIRKMLYTALFENKLPEI